MAGIKLHQDATETVCKYSMHGTTGAFISFNGPETERTAEVKVVNADLGFDDKKMGANGLVCVLLLWISCVAPQDRPLFGGTNATTVTRSFEGGKGVYSRGIW